MNRRWKIVFLPALLLAAAAWARASVSGSSSSSQFSTNARLAIPIMGSAMRAD